MTNKSLIFAGIFVAITSSSFATGENTVTSKSYVDAQDALKQDKITAKTTGNVVTYNGTGANGQTQFDERGIFDGDADYTDNDADSLITAGVVADFASAVESITIPDNKLTCYDAPYCTLWQISDGTVALADAGTFAPLTAAAPSCKAYGETASNASECCSGNIRMTKPATCGCDGNSDCPSGMLCMRGGDCA
jgi:hypothetical protein